MKRTAFKVDPVTRDIVISGGRIATVTDIDVVLQNCDHALRQQLKELQYNQEKGIEYFGNVFDGNPNYQLFKFQAIQQIENVSGVIRVQEFDYSVTNGVLEYDALIITEYGPAGFTSQQPIGISTAPDVEIFEAPDVPPPAILDGILYAGTSPLLAGTDYVGV